MIYGHWSLLRISCGSTYNCKISYTSHANDQHKIDNLLKVGEKYVIVGQGEVIESL